MDKIKAARLAEGYCYGCAAFRGTYPSCGAMSKGCPVPENVLPRLKEAAMDAKKKRSIK